MRNDKHNLLAEDTDFDNLGRHNSLRKNNGAGFMTKNYSNLLKILILGIVYFPNIKFVTLPDGLKKTKINTPLMMYRFQGTKI